ncbi:hypothetical protein O181_024768 [Austropuccinia psidii MF-1]|uniref:Uncharacterized protein n=1 Tax=Austropuccinia psidii MF-1 TaxID=1389203 RepID=A0A9Q3CLD9_9BASI|nr:hypothetical protein [Austropuccinia psidii MF-1]
MLVMLANKHTRNSCSLSDPSDHAASGVPNQDALARTPLWSAIMKAFPSGNGHQDPKQEDGNDSRQLAQSSQVLICPPPPRLPLNGLRWQEDIQAWANRHPWDSNAKNEPTKSPIPSLPCQQTPWQLTPGPSGTQWFEPKFNLISTFDSSELTLPPFVEPSQTDEPPIPGLSPSSEPHEDVPTREPEPDVAPTQSMEESFGKSQLYLFYSSQLFLSFPLTISSLSHSTPLHHHH